MNHAAWFIAGWLAALECIVLAGFTYQCCIWLRDWREDRRRI